MSDDPWIKDRVEAIQKSAKFFCDPKRKGERELLTARGFLDTLGVTYSADEVVLHDDEPPDVVFRDARFEVKELLDQGRRRDDEYREAARRAARATSRRDLFEEWDAEDVPLEQVAGEVIAVAGDQKKYAADVKAGLDLLVYFNRQVLVEGVDGKGGEPPALGVQAGDAAGFRSVCVYGNSFAVVLHAGEAAPAFLEGYVGRVYRRTR